jgi:hypothetical protein
MSNQTTTDQSQVDPSVLAALQAAAGQGSNTNVANARAPLGVGDMYNDSGQDRVVYEDGSVGSPNPDGSVPPKMKSDGKTPQKSVLIHPGQVMTDTNGVPIPQVAQRTTLAASPISAIATPVVQFVPAQYRPGDEWTALGSMPPEQRQQWVTMMQDKGLLSATSTPTPAQWANAMQGLMSMANASGSDWQTELQNMPSVDLSAKYRPQSIAPVLDNPQDLAALYKKSYAQLTGFGNPPQDQIDRFVAADQAAQKQAAVDDQTAKEAAARVNGLGLTQPDYTQMAPSVEAPEGGITDPNKPPVFTSTSAPNQQTLAEGMIRQQNPALVHGTALASQYNALLSLLSSGVSHPDSTVGTPT